MKVRISTTIPTSRQYENIKTEYEGDIAERETMINYAKRDLEELNSFMKRPEGTPKFMYSPSEGDKCIMGNTEFIFKGGKWEYTELKETKKIKIIDDDILRKHEQGMSL